MRKYPVAYIRNTSFCFFVVFFFSASDEKARNGPKFSAGSIEKVVQPHPPKEAWLPGPPLQWFDSRQPPNRRLMPQDCWGRGQVDGRVVRLNSANPLPRGNEVSESLSRHAQPPLRRSQPLPQIQLAAYLFRRIRRKVYNDAPCLDVCAIFNRKRKGKTRDSESINKTDRNPN